MGRRRSKNDMVDFGDFLEFRNGLCVFKCKTCKQQLEIKNLDLFVIHVKENHPKTQKITDIRQGFKKNKEYNPHGMSRRLPLSKINKRLKGNNSINIFKNKKEAIPKLNIRLKLSQADPVHNKKYEIFNKCEIGEKKIENQLNKTNKLEEKTKTIQGKNEFINDKDFFKCVGNELKVKEETIIQSDSDNINNSFDDINFDNYDSEVSKDINLETALNDSLLVKSFEQSSEMGFWSIEVVKSEISVNENNSDISLSDTIKRKFNGTKSEMKNNFQICTKDFSSKSKLQQCDLSDIDLKYGNDKKANVGKNCSYTCKKCGIIYKKEKTLIRHVEICEGNKNHRSKKQFQSKIKLRQKNENGMYQCTNCESEFSLIDEIESHEKLHELKKENKKTQCEICGKYLNSIPGLNLHLMRHSGRSPFKCLICDRGFYNKYTLASHQQIHNPDKEYKCEHCDKEYARYVDLKRHVRYSHLKDKPNPVMCDLCGKSFSFTFNLKYHMRRHLNVKPIKCDKCDMTFVERGDLNKHLITHNPDHKPFVCEICSKSFSRKITLTKHQKLHTGLKEYVCKICGKAFAQSPGLYMHMKTHGFNIKPEGAGYYERQSHLLFRNMNSDRANLG